MRTVIFPPRRRRWWTTVAVTAAALVVAGACSSSTVTLDPGLTMPATPVPTVGSTTAATSPTTAVPATTAATATSAAPATTRPATTTTVAPSTPQGPALADVFPGAVWEHADLPSGVDRTVLDDAVARAFGAPDNAARVRSLVVVHGGKIVYERYHPLDSATTVMDSYSVAKSFTSAAIGLLAGDGTLRIDDPAPVAAWADPTDPRHPITAADLLHMASGLSWDETYSGDSDVIRMLAAPVASDYVASLPLAHPPGTVFEYSTGTTAILAGIFTDAIGSSAGAMTALHDRLLDPIGITTAELLTDPAGRWYGGLGANMTSTDFARFGQLYLHDGVWDGTRLLPAGWVDYSRTPSPANPAYGAQWWLLHPDSFEARGLFGQIILVSQRNDLVVVINSMPGGDADTLVGTVYDEFRRALGTLD